MHYVSRKDLKRLVSANLIIGTSKKKDTAHSTKGYVDWPLGQVENLQVRNKSQDEKQQNKTKILILCFVYSEV